MKDRWTGIIARRVRRWARRRQGADNTPVQLVRRRIYILPTRFGAIYAAIAFAMLLGSMNYSNSLGFALTFLLAGLGVVTMHHCHRNLSGLTVSGVLAGETFAGEPLRLQVALENASGLRRFELEVDCIAQDKTPAAGERRPAMIHSLVAGARALATVEVPTQQRGVWRMDRVTLSTQFPFGLFRAWSWVYLPVEALVYPHPAGAQQPPADTVTAAGSTDSRERGSEDFRGFRGYVPGDSPRHVAWKALARGAPLLVKDYSGSARAPVLLDFAAVRSGDTETRLSQLCRWVLDADRGAQVFGLRLPGRHLPVRSGAHHRRQCLEALALFGTDRAP